MPIAPPEPGVICGLIRLTEYVFGSFRLVSAAWAYCPLYIYMSASFMDTVGELEAQTH